MALHHHGRSRTIGFREPAPLPDGTRDSMWRPGAAVGPAHIGVFKAFTERGVTFDILGGTSVGAAMRAALRCC